MLKIEENVSLKDFSTFRIGGKVARLFRIKSQSDLEAFLVLARQEQRPYFILGGGSNVLFSDEDWPGWVAKIENEEKLFLKGKKIVCGAGVALSRLVNFAKDNSLFGLEWAAGIPGTVGGAIRGNAGAFGGEMKDSVEKVIYFDLDKKNFAQETFLSKECRFGYRQSIFKKERQRLIWEAEFSLSQGSKEEIEKKMKEFLVQRQSNQPTLGQFPSAGSVFKNPAGTPDLVTMFEKEKNTLSREGKIPAGWLIEKCGLKGEIIGGAQISQRQANFIVNLGEASAKDVLALIDLVRKKVKENFRVELEAEIEILK